MPRFRLTVEYDGRPFMGWQRQPHGPTVQAAVEDALTSITGEHHLVYGCGRTDAGVHALAMPAHVDVDSGIDAFRLSEALNAKLRPELIAILACEEVSADFHARFGCTGREYRYLIRNRRAPLYADRRPRMAAVAPARRRSHASRSTASGGKARLHDVPERALPGRFTRENHPLDRCPPPGRPGRYRCRRALLSSSPGAVDHRLSFHGGRRSLDDPGHAGRARRQGPGRTGPQCAAGRTVFPPRSL